MTDEPSLRLPTAIRRHVDPARLARDTLGRSEASVYDCGGAFLKIAPKDSLRRAALMQDYFARRGLSAPLIAYEQDERRDYLLVQTVPGQNACAFTGDPRWLSAALGEAARRLHETDAADCPLTDVNRRAAEACARETGEVIDPAPLSCDALVQGDCCLPNIFFQDGRLTGFIDLNEAGLGDRHFDIGWLLWSLAYNLRTADWNDRLLDAYGRDAIDADRLALCRRLSSL